MKQNWIVVGALSGAIAVGLGAFGAHGLAERLDTRQLEVWRTAVHYQMFHAVVLLALGLMARGAGSAQRSRALAGAGWALLAGTVGFCGSLYGLALGGPALLGPITPLGGAAFIVGWVLLAWAGRKPPESPGRG
jgi:uncharacterized membrane protein YgdD (TMEM256/DUF423 family)